MVSVCDPPAEWRDNERAFQDALSELKGPAAAFGLVLEERHDAMQDWPYVLHAAVRTRGSLRLLSCLDVGLDTHGKMLVQTIPGEARTFASFQPRDKSFYLRSFRRLVVAALANDPD